MTTTTRPISSRKPSKLSKLRKRKTQRLLKVRKMRRKMSKNRVALKTEPLKKRKKSSHLS